MAYDLQTSYPGSGASLYVVVRAQADGTVWDTTTSALVTFVNADVANYDVPLADLGGDLYGAAMPTDLPAGDYRFIYYEQAGGTPATTDLILKTVVARWNASALTDESEVVLSDYVLTDLAAVKRRLGMEDDSSSDTLLTEIINGVSSEIERITGRRFKARDWRVWINGSEQRQVTLPYWPVQHMTRVAFGVANALSVTFAAGSGIRANASVYKSPESADAGGLRLVSVDSSGVPTATSLSFATYRSVSALATAVNLISGWTATTITNVPSLDLHASGGEDALGRTVTLTYPDRDDYGYSIDYEAGILTFARGDWWCTGYRGGHAGGPEGVSGWYGPMTMPRQFQGASIEYRAGYETIPDDVKLVATELVFDNFYDAQFGNGATELKLGPSVVKFSETQKDYVRDRLSSYIDPSRMIGGV